MEVVVTGRHINTGESFTQHVNDQITTLAEKFQTTFVDAHVVMSKLGHEFVCDISVHMGRGTYARCHGEGVDAYLAFEAAANKLENRLRKYKQRLIGKHRNKDSSEIQQQKVAKYIINGEHSQEDTQLEDENLAPAVIAQMNTNIPRVSVADALMHMDLIEDPVFIFRNLKHGGVNVLYKRKDGNVGWFDIPNAS